MGRIRHLFPGGNTCYGFHSFYDHLVKPTVQRKFILKGGPGVGKSTLMKQIGDHFSDQGYMLEYHWCSSDSNSLDGIVIGDHQVCFLDGTAPHVVDPVFPGAVDEIVNLGQYWSRESIAVQRETVQKLTSEISFCFQRAYHRLKEAQLAVDDWSSYYRKVREERAVSRNILALTNDFLQGATAHEKAGIRHLFPGAISPGGIVCKISSLLDKDTAIFAVKGSPGSGVKDLFRYTAQMMELSGIQAEVFHNPLDPADIDLIIIPEINRALLDVTDTVFEYSRQLSSPRYRRQLDFDQLLAAGSIDPFARRIAEARERLESGVAQSVEWIELAKQIHDNLEKVYVPSMDFEAVDKLRDDLIEQAAQVLV